MSLLTAGKQAAMNLLGFDPLRRYFHGSTHDITEFSKDMANPEGHFGAGFYFTSSPDDVAKHYAGYGPDLTNRIQQRAEQLASEMDLEYDDPKVLEMATKEIAGESQGATYPIRLKTENTFDITKDGDTFLEFRGPDLDPEDYRSEAMDDVFRDDYDSVTEYNDALNERMQELADEDSYNFEFEGPLADFIESLERNEYLDANQDQVRELIEDIRMMGLDEGGISAKKLDEMMRNTPLYAEDDMGRLVDNEVYRQAIQDAGFDSISHDADIFRGMDVPEGTKHTIVFEPNQIRSEYAEYNPDNADSGNILASALGYGTTGLLGASALMSPEAEAGAATQFIRLLEAGYPESTARKIMSGELPMDEASRMNRAREQGFRTEAYHTGSPDIKEIDPTGTVGARSDAGMWFSQDPVVAASYTKPESAGYRVLLNTGNYGQYDAGGAAWNDFYGNTEYASAKDGFINIDDRGISTTNQVARLAKELGDAGVEIADVVDLGGNAKVMRQVAEKVTPNRSDWISDYEAQGAVNYSAQDPSTVRSYYGAAFDPDNVGKPYIMGSPAAVGLLATEAATPEGQLNPLLAVPAEIGSALNEAIVGTADFLVPDTVNAVSELIGSEYRMPRLSDQELVKLYTQGGYMDEGYGRDAIRTATGLLSPL